MAQALGGGGATGGASGVTAPKQVPIVPTIDTSKLPTTPISVKATISGFDISGTATYPDVKIAVCCAFLKALMWRKAQRHQMFFFTDRASVRDRIICKC